MVCNKTNSEKDTVHSIHCCFESSWQEQQRYWWRPQPKNLRRVFDFVEIVFCFDHVPSSTTLLHAKHRQPTQKPWRLLSLVQIATHEARSRLRPRAAKFVVECSDTAVPVRIRRHFNWQPTCRNVTNDKRAFS